MIYEISNVIDYDCNEKLILFDLIRFWMSWIFFDVRDFLDSKTKQNNDDRKKE